jgi:leucyl aminopeptidase
MRRGGPAEADADAAHLWQGDLVAAWVRHGTGEPVAGAFARLVADRYGVDLTAVMVAEKVSGRPGEVVRVPVPAAAGLPGRFLLLGIGAGRPADLRRAGAALGRAGRGRQAVLAGIDGAPSGSGAGGTAPADEAVQAFVEGLLLGGHTPSATGLTDRSDAAPVHRVRLVRAGRVGGSPAGHRAAAQTGERLARATLLARDLAGMPSSVKSPAWLADRAVRVAAGSGLAVDVWDEARLARDGFGGLLAVGGGSASAPRLVRLDYVPERSRGGRVVLVGKGITFDTGGLSIKPRESMLPMRTDMSGAAAVLAAVAACREVGVRRPVTALLPLAENAVGAASYRPGDVLRQYGGRTVEVANTDAEGRLVLADALAYADTVLDPAVLVDLATLTGAASLGLGKRHAALYATDDRLAAGLEAASAASGERVWRMPLVEEYARALDSEVADLRHIARDGRIGGGSITAALFLREFTGGRAWAHLDIAGPARADKDEHEVGRGPTGFGSRLLLHWLSGLR